MTEKANKTETVVQAVRREVSRRRFLTSVALGAGAGLAGPLALGRSRQVSARAVPFCAEPPSLGVQDLGYLGYYDLQPVGMDTPFGQGLTHRYVSGELRFLHVGFRGKLYEFSITGKSFGGLIDSMTSSWDISSYNILRDFNAIWYESAQSRLWLMGTVDYTTTVNPVGLYTLTLNSDGTIGNLHGPVGLTGINSKRAYGGVQPVPAWFQSQYGVGPYVCGWGGYTSLMAQGGGCSLGPTMYAFPDPASFGNGSQIPSGNVKVIMDCSSGTGPTDWYSAGSPSTFDRGVRVTNPINYFDGGDLRQNPSTLPPGPPGPGAGWLSPSPDGLGRFTWGDSYYNTGCWIDTPTKRGFLLVASLGGGRCWYGDSTLNFDSRQFEIHIFDPARLGEVVQGTRKVWNVKPSSLTQVNLAGLGTDHLVGNVPNGNVSGATYDSVTKRLYILGMGVNSYYNRLYVYSVNA